MPKTESRRIPRPDDAPGSLADPESFRNSLVAWFRENGRDYPWRRTREPYAVLVSEAMLQQTQIATVLGKGYFGKWMRAFPDWETLAAASETEVLKAWEGLGYYNRARNLQRTAKAVCTEFGGRFPECPDQIRALPGVGPYTAGAILSLALGRPAALVDGNVSRVLSRVFACPEPIDSSAGRRLAWARAEALVPESDPGTYNSALMELGQRLCRPSSPDCGACPVAPHCLALARGETGRYPVKRKAAPPIQRVECVILARSQGRVWLEPERGTRRRGLWRLPEISPEAAEDLAERFRFDYPITRYRVSLRVHDAPPGWSPSDGDGGGSWFPLDDPGAWPPLGAPYRKALLRFSEAAEPL